MKLGLIGAGNMGTAILEGAINKGILTGSCITSYDKIHHKSIAFSQRIKGHVALDLGDLIKKNNVLLLAIKPQDFQDFAIIAKRYLCKKQRVISILAGLTIEKICRALGVVSVVRAMPNLGAKAGASMTVIAGQDQKALCIAKRLFEGCGDVVCLPERTFDHVTALSGSGPAYFFYLMELMTGFAVKQGIPADAASRLAVQTGLGAALVAKQAKIPCGELRKMVTSKKGTTEAALKTLIKGNFGGTFRSALVAASTRSRQLNHGK